MGKPSSAATSDLWESADWLADDLFEDETVLWAGRPRSSRSAVLAEVPTALLGVGMFGLGLLSMAGMLSHGLEPGKALALHRRILLAACVGAWTVPTALMMIACPLFARRRMACTYYTLTNLRAIVVEPDFLGRPRVRSFWPPHLRLMEWYDGPDGTGDLVFCKASPPAAFPRDYGFLGIDRAARVEALIRCSVLAPADGGS